MARNVYGIDLGTYEIKVYDKKKEVLWKEKNVIAIENEKNILAIGDEAYEMYEKVPDNIEVVFPMKYGVISRFNDMQYLLQNLLKKDSHFARGAEYVIAVPTDVTEVEKRAFFDLVIHSTAKAREVNIVERAIADAIGLGINVETTKGVMIVNLGGETTEVSILASGGIVVNQLLKTGGMSFDAEVANKVRNNHDFLIGHLTAEILRRKFGVFDDDKTESMKVSGRNLVTGVPQQMDISVGLVRAAIKDPLKECINAIMFLIERTPPEVLLALKKNGIYLTGGLANLPGIATYVRETTGFRVRETRNPEFCAVSGLKQVIQSKNMKKWAYSMLDNNYRWMR